MKLFRFLFILISLQSVYFLLDAKSREKGLKKNSIAKNMKEKSKLQSAQLYYNMIESALEENNTDLGYITIDNPHFKPFLISLVNNALEKGIENRLSNGLLRCYEQVCKNSNDFSVEDLKKAFPDLIAEFQQMQTRAPRQGVSSNIVGPGSSCNLSIIEALLRQIQVRIGSIINEFTVIIDIKNTITECCANITNEFNGTFTAIFDVKNTLTECCANITNEFNGTFSVLNSLATGCHNISITQGLIDALGGSFTISSPGNYVLTENITSNAASIFIINSSDVTFNLCGRSILGSGVANVGIQINSGLENITIKNGEINNVAFDGIRVFGGASNLKIMNLTITQAAESGINFFAFGGSPIAESIIKQCNISLCATAGLALGGISLVNCENVIIESCLVDRNGSGAVNSAGISLIGCNYCRVARSSMNLNVGICVYGLHSVSGIGNL